MTLVESYENSQLKKPSRTWPERRVPKTISGTPFDPLRYEATEFLRFLEVGDSDSEKFYSDFFSRRHFFVPSFRSKQSKDDFNFRAKKAKKAANSH